MLADLSKAWRTLDRKTWSICFDYSALAFVSSYLSGRKHRTKVKIHFRKQGNILVPLLFNIYILVIFFCKWKMFANYSDDNTPDAIDKCFDAVLNALKNDTRKVIGWFNNNSIKINADKWNLLITKLGKYFHLNWVYGFVVSVRRSGFESRSGRGNFYIGIIHINTL